MPHEGQVNRDSSLVAPPTCWPITDCKIAVRFISCCLSSSCFSAHSWHKCFSRFLPSTMSVKWTVAVCPQDWHFTSGSLLPQLHSPLLVFRERGAAYDSSTVLIWS